MDTRNLKASTSCLIVFSMEGAVHAFMSFCVFNLTKISKQSALAVQQLLEIININPPASSGLRSLEPADGLTNCLLYEETFINSDGDMPHRDECMGQQDREW